VSPFRRFHSLAALCGNGLRPELQVLFDRLAVDPHAELQTRWHGSIRSEPDLEANVVPECHERDQHLARRQHPAFGPAPEMSVGRLGYCRAFTVCLFQTQGLFTAFCTETYPDIPGFFTGLSRDICTGNPQASPLDHPPVFHKFSTGCRPIRPRANSGPWPGATGTPPVGLV
jgi:hypothetical protein